jgi:hypothetical protein
MSRTDKGIDIADLTSPDPDAPFSTKAINTIDYWYRMDAAPGGPIDREAGAQRTKGYVLQMLLEFTQEKIEASARRRDPLVVTLRALDELQTVLRFLVDAGHREFAPQIECIERGMMKIKKTITDQLLKQFSSPGTTPADIWLIHETLAQMYGQEDWRRELYQEFERCRSSQH